jgi:hypothetical protein
MIFNGNRFFRRNPRFELKHSTNLLIKNLTVNDSGSYTCRICALTTNCDERTAYLDVRVQSTFVKKPKNLTKPVNSDVLFECEVDGEPKPVVNWYKNGELILSSEYFQYQNETNLRILGILFDNKKPSLLISNNFSLKGIIKQDEGYYQCIATNILKTAIATAYLHVIDDEYSNFFLPGQRTDQHNHIIKVQKPSNIRLNKDEKSIYLNWTKSNVENYITTENEPIVYVITWKASNDKRIRAVNTTRLNQVIDSLTPNRDYQINISSIFNSTIKSEVVTFNDIRIENPDDAYGIPYNISVEFLTSQIIKIKWKFNLMTDLLKFRLFIIQTPIMQQAHSHGDSRANGEKFLDIYMQHLTVSTQNEFSFVLEDLKKFCAYSFRLVGFTKDKMLQSKSSQSVEVRTQSDVPDGAPENIITERLNTTAIRVSWDTPAWDKCNGLITGYKLVLKFDEQVKNFYLGSEPRSFVLGQLTPGKNLKVCRLNFDF